MCIRDRIYFGGRSGLFDELEPLLEGASRLLFQGGGPFLGHRHAGVNAVECLRSSHDTTVYSETKAEHTPIRAAPIRAATVRERRMDPAHVTHFSNPGRTPISSPVSAARIGVCSAFVSLY